MTAADEALRLPPRRGKIIAVCAIAVIATFLLAWAMTQPDSGLGPEDFYVAIFPILAIASAYRLVRPRIPFTADSQGVTIDTGLPFLGLKAFIAWPDIARIRINARDLLLVELKSPNRWVEDKPWRVRANMRANRRKFDADAIVALAELARPPGGIATTLRELGGVKVSSV